MLGGGDDDGTVTLDAQSGCAPFSTPSRPATTALQQAESALAGHHEEKVTVRRGARDEPSRRLFWAWQVTDGQPIDFSVAFTPTGGGLSALEAAHPSRTYRGAVRGSIEGVQPGVYALRWEGRPGRSSRRRTLRRRCCVQSEAERLLGPAVDPLYMEPGEGASALAPAGAQPAGRQGPAPAASELRGGWMRRGDARRRGAGREGFRREEGGRRWWALVVCLGVGLGVLLASRRGRVWRRQVQSSR